MNNLFDKKPKKSTKYSQRNLVGIPTNIVAGPLGFRVAELDAGSKGGEGTKDTRIIFQGKAGEDEQLPALESPSPGAVIDGADHVRGPSEENAADAGDQAVQLSEPSKLARGDWKDTTLGGARILLDVAKEAAEAFPPLKATLGAISAICTNYKDTVAVGKKSQRLRSRVEALEAIFRVPSDDMEEQARRDELLRKFKDTEAQLRFLSEKPGLQRFADHGHDADEISGLLEDLQETISDYQMVQQMAIHKQNCELIDAGDASVLNRFPSAKEAEHRHGDRNGCLKGTRGTILDKIESWMDDCDKPIYWLTGLVGTGKSAIAQTIAERAFENGKLGASFFCSRDFKEGRDPYLIFPTLAVQLARKYSQFRSAFVPLVQSDPGLADVSLSLQMEKLIVQPLRGTNISTVIIIDALDECEERGPTSKIISVIGKFSSEIPGIKFFLTGRPEQQIQDGFRIHSLVEKQALHDADPKLVYGDILLFLQRSLKKVADRREVPGDWPTEEQLDLLCKRAAGLFVYAVATVKFIDQKQKNGNPIKRLDLLLQSPESSTHEGRTGFLVNAGQTATLDLLYMSILREAFGNDSDPVIDPKIRSVLGVVILALNPLSPSTIAAFLDFEVEDVPPFLSPFHSLLILDDKNPNHSVRPFHKSFPDFITDRSRCDEQRFHISPPDHHSELVIGCLELMNKRLKRNMFGFPDAVTNNEVRSLQKRARQDIDQGLQYACELWHQHLVKASTEQDHELKVTSVLHRFLEEKFLFWLETLSILGTARAAVDALEVAIKWLKASPTLDLVNDYYRFVTGFFEVINTSGPHIYHSALPLSPHDSLVWKLHRQHAHPLVRVVHGVSKSWDPAIAVMKSSHDIECTAWSPCGRFIAIGSPGSRMGIQILDAVTLDQINWIDPLQHNTKFLTFSAENHLLGQLSNRPRIFTSWDLQTGYPTSSISMEQGDFLDQDDPMGGFGSFYQELHNKTDQEAMSITYSECGTMLGVLFKNPSATTIVIYKVFSSVVKRTYQIKKSALDKIWIHEKCLRYATFVPGTITIWEVGFTPEHPPKKVESLPTPNDFELVDDFRKGYLFLPNLSRLAFSLERTPGANSVHIWDAQHSRFLLDSTAVKAPRNMTFSPDGHFFACGSGGSELYLWKDSPTGYDLYQTIISSSRARHIPCKPLLSPDGQMIVASVGPTLQLWQTTDPATSPTAVPSLNNRPFIVEFSLDESMAATAQLGGTIATVVNLKSGVPQLNIDTSMKICGLRAARGYIVIAGEGKILTWSLPPPTEDCTLTPMANTDNSNLVLLSGYSNRYCFSMPTATISPDLNYVVYREPEAIVDGLGMQMFDIATGQHLSTLQLTGSIPYFTPDGQEVWCHHPDPDGQDSQREGYTIVKDSLAGIPKLQYIPKTQLEGHPWLLPHGYTIVDGWLLGSGGKRLLWLPPYWRSQKGNTKWSGQFLAFLNPELPEPAIIDLLETSQ